MSITLLTQRLAALSLILLASGCDASPDQDDPDINASGVIAPETDDGTRSPRVPEDEPQTATDPQAVPGTSEPGQAPERDPADRPSRVTTPAPAETDAEDSVIDEPPPDQPTVEERADDASGRAADETAPDDVDAENVASPEPTLRDDVVYGTGFFTSATDKLIGNGAKLRYGVAVTDIDLDGDFEAVVAGYNGANEVWDWTGAQVVDATPPGLADATRKAIGVSACDVDDDGAEEIYFLNIDQFGGQGQVADRLWRRDGDTWSDVFDQPANLGQINTFSGRSVACFDRTGDGRYGVFVANYGGPMKLFEYEAGALVDVAPSIGANLVTGGRALVNVPLDGGQMNLFAGNENGANFFFVGDGSGSVDNLAAGFGITDASHTVRGATVLDADGDGDFDLVYGNWNGPHRLWLREGDAFVLGTPPEMEEPSRIRTVIAADFDNDGTEEIFWNNIGEPNRLFGRVDGAWTSLAIGDALEPSGNGTGAAVLDVDGDGTLELLVSHGESGAQPLSLFVADARGNHFLRVQPLTASGGPARGAQVVLARDGATQRRAVDAGSGYLCQMEPVAHFGLGQDATVPQVTVTWPDGHVVTAAPPHVDGTFTLARSGQWVTVDSP